MINESTLDYTHVQTVPSTTWTIPHGLNTIAPIVDVRVNVNGSILTILPDEVTVVDAGTLIVEFTTGYAGEAKVK